MNAATSHPGSAGEFVTLARVVKTQGRRGEVGVEVHSDVPGRFREGMHLFALLDERKLDREKDSKREVRRELEIVGFWPHKEWLVLKFEGVDSIDEAEILIGSELQVPSAERAKLDHGWNFVSDLIGCVALDRGREIGRIEDVRFGAGEAPLLIVSDAAGKQSDVPFADAYLEGVDINRREVRMKLPEGMLEVNAPLTAEEKSAQTAAKQPGQAGKRRAKRSGGSKQARKGF